MIRGMRPASSKDRIRIETIVRALRLTERGSLEAMASVVPEGNIGVGFRRALPLAGLLLTPVAVIAAALAAWRFGADAGWTNTFFDANGFLSHWQVWCAFAISVQVCAWSLGPDAGTHRAKNLTRRARWRFRLKFIPIYRRPN